MRPREIKLVPAFSTRNGPREEAELKKIISDDESVPRQAMLEMFIVARRVESPAQD